MRALVARGRGGRGFVEHPRGSVALVVPPERVGQGGGELQSLRRIGWEQRSRPAQQSGSRRRIALVVRSAAGCGQVSRGVGREAREPGRTRIDLDLRVVCGLQVVADELVGFDAPPARAVGDDRRDLLMQGRSPALRDAGVGLVAHERVPEPPHLVAEDVGRFRLDEVPARKRHECSTHVDLDDGVQHLGREALSVHGGSLGDLALGLGKPVEPRREQRVDRVRHAGLAFQRRCEQLLEEERVPGCPRENRRTVVVVERCVGVEAVEQHAGLIRWERVEEDRRGVQPAPGPLRPGVEELGSREAEQQDRRPGELGHMLDEVEEGRCRPVQVLEHEDDRPPSRECLEQPARGPGCLLDGACRRRFARRRSDPRRDDVGVPLAREDGGGPRSDAPARKRGEGIAKGRVRGGLAGGGCAADHAGRSS